MKVFYKETICEVSFLNSMQVKFVAKRQKKTASSGFKKLPLWIFEFCSICYSPHIRFYFEFYSASFSDGAIFNVKSSI
jgi:hypothetical protein